jgi:phage shock protein A
MGILSKILSLSKKKVADIEDKLDQKHGIEIASQEIKDAKVEIANTIKELYNIGANKKILEDKVEKTQKKINQYEKKAIEYLNKNEEESALKTSEKIADLEDKLKLEETELKNITEAFNLLKKNIDEAKRNISRTEHKLNQIKVTNKLNKVKSLTADLTDISGNNLELKNSYLSKLAEQQEFEEKRLEVIREYEQEENLIEEVENSKDNRGNEILERLKEKIQQS